MRRLKILGCSSDRISLGCIYLCMVSVAHGYRLGGEDSEYLNDLNQVEENFEDGGVPHKRTIGAGEGGFQEDVNGGIDDGAVGFNEGGGSGGFLSLTETPPKLIEARKFGKVVLECSATGTPAPEIKWYKDGRPFHKVFEKLQTVIDVIK